MLPIKENQKLYAHYPFYTQQFRHKKHRRGEDIFGTCMLAAYEGFIDGCQKPFPKIPEVKFNPAR